MEKSEKLGPFCNPGAGEYMRLSGRCTGVILSGKIYTRVLAALEKMAIASVFQASMYLSAPVGRVKRAMNALFKEGYLDKITVGNTPALYTIGPQGRRVLQVPDIEWDAYTAFRAVAANQLCLTLKANWWSVKPDKGFSGSMELTPGNKFYLLSPRMGEVEYNRCIAITNLLDRNKKLIVIAVSKVAALEIAKQLRKDIPVRFTWDTELTTFYCLRGETLIPAESFAVSSMERKTEKVSNIF